MKGLITAVIGMSLLFIACKKNSDDPSGGNGSSPAGSGAIRITAISPQKPHPDNQITITGSGFNPDKSKDIVNFGNYDTTKKIFMAYGTSTIQDNKSILISASATELVFKSYDSSWLNIDVMDAPKYYRVPAIQVIANGDTTVLPVNFQEMVRIQDVYDPLQPQQTISDGWPNDSLFIECNGPVDHTASLTIGGLSCDFTTENVPENTEHRTILHSFMPKALGTSNNDTLMAPQIVKLTLADGTVEQRVVQFYVSPIMKISKMGADQSSYSQSGLTSSGGVINVNITGKNLKSDATYTITRYGVAGAVATGSLDVSNFPDQATIVLPGSLSQDRYFVSVYRKNLYNGNSIFYGSCEVDILP